MTTSNGQANNSYTDQDLVHLKPRWYEQWVADNVPDLTGKVAVVTGCNSGVGYWAANALAGKGCTVVMACRSLEKAEKAKKSLLELNPDAKLDIIQMDNMDFASVRTFAKAFDGRYDRLDFLLNNAGVMALPLTESKDGHDVQFQTNHLAHFLLTKLLWNKLVSTPGQSRVVNHSSIFHFLGNPRFDKDKLDYPSHSPGWFGCHYLLKWLAPLGGFSEIDRYLRYGVSKLCNNLMMRKLHEKIEAKSMSDKVIAVSCHPGWASTGLMIKAADAWKLWKLQNRCIAQSAQDGSLPLLMATVSDDVRNGDYTGPSSLFALRGKPRKARVRGNGNDKAMQQSLWDYSEECIGEKFEV